MIAGQERQLKLINSLLEAHAQDVTGVALELQPMKLRELVEAIASELPPQLQQSQASIQIVISADLPLIAADPLQLRRVYDNMISNALQHNRPGLSITLGASVQGNYANCTVSDNGQGIRGLYPEGIPHSVAAQRLFDRYSSGINRRQPLHLGLGLYICQQIIEAHGGTIGVDSSPQQGTTFWFTLPLVKPPDAVQRGSLPNAAQE